MVFASIYISTLRARLSEVESAQMLQASRMYNDSRKITGMLTVRGVNVMQLIEGDENQVRILLDRIHRDPRHDGILTVWSGSYPSRRYPDWSMGMTRLDEADTPRPTLARSLATDWLEGDDPTADYAARSEAALRRALASGNPLTSSLAVILSLHQPASDDRSTGTGECLECRPSATSQPTRSPSFTARNAIWAIEAML